jgi:hypothetical protein
VPEVWRRGESERRRTTTHRKWFLTPLLFSLCGFQDSFSERLGNRNRQEEALGIEVVFSGLVNHADLTGLESHRVGKGDIDLSLFKGDGAPLVLDANQKSKRHTFRAFA